MGWGRLRAVIHLRPWLGPFRDWMELQGWSRRTIEERVRLTRFEAFLAVQGCERLSEVSREVIEAYRLHLFGVRPALSLSAQTNLLNAVKAFFRFLTEQRFLLMDPAASVAAPRQVRQLPLVLSEKDVRRLLEAPDVRRPLGLRDRAILEMLYSTGLRNSELRALELEDLQLDRGLVRVRFGKGGKSRMAVLGEEAAWWLERYLAEARPRLARGVEGTHVFLGQRGPIRTREALAEVVQRAARKAGITRRVTPHGLRHAVATHMLRRGAGLRHLQEMLGHASAGTTQLYTKVELKDLQRVHRRCHPRERRQS